MVYEYPQNKVDSSSIVSPSAIIGEGNYIGPNCYIGPNVIIGNNNRIEGFSSIGTPPEYRGMTDDFGSVRIGDNNVIREFTTINSSVKKCTEIKNRCLLMKGSHVGHDAVIEDDVTLSCNSLVGGFSHLMKGCNIGLGVAIHQRVVIGAYCMIGMNSCVTRKSEIIPGRKYVGNPARDIGPNNYSIEKFSILDSDLQLLINDFFKKKSTLSK